MDSVNRNAEFLGTGTGGVANIYVCGNFYRQALTLIEILCDSIQCGSRKGLGLAFTSELDQATIMGYILISAAGLAMCGPQISKSNWTN